jgi:hypothetical protein
MNPIKNLLLPALVGLLALTSGVFAQTSEVSMNLLSQLARANGDGSGQFNISFGSLNGGLVSLLSKDSSADGASGFATWYGNNSRTLLSWNGVTGSAIDGSDAFYRYYGADTTVSTRVGDALTSIYDSSKDNRALAFVSYSNGGVVQEIGLYDFGFDWGNAADTGAFPLGLYDIFTLASSIVTPIYGSTNDNAGANGTIYTSTVPEPSATSLILLGAAGILALRRLRKNIV